MRSIRLKGCFILLIALFSACKDTAKPEVKSAHWEKTVTDVKNMDGNVFVFFEAGGPDSRVYIIPVEEKDSVVFKKMDVANAIKGRVSIQLNFGCFSDYYSDLYTAASENLFSQKACNLPSDSMHYLRAYLQYKNYEEIEMHIRDADGKKMKLPKEDSCNSKLISSTDSSSFEFLKIYQ